MNNIPKIVISAVSSSCGKTTIVTGIIAALRRRNIKVQAYKIGPDYIDTSYHSLASGRPAHNLDTWLIPANKLNEIFEATAQDADIAIIEGVMGLYDGGRGGISSTAEVAKLLNAPVILVIDAKSIGTSAAAIALGFREYDRDVNIAGVILNRIGSDNHKQIIEEALDKLNIKCFGAVRRDDKLKTPERHLGLLPTHENTAVELIDYIGNAIEEQINIDALIDLAGNKENKQTIHQLQYKHEVNIGVAYDEAFNFYYPASLNVLEKLGAKIIKFSPLHDKQIPNVDGLIIGGGFPEMFAAQLESNESMHNSIKTAADEGIPIFAECGGYMYLMNELTDFNGSSYKMVGVIDNSAKMNERLQMVGYVKAALTADCILGKAGDVFHAHEFHFSNAVNNDRQNVFNCVRIRNNEKYSAGFMSNNVVASYLHIHFAGCVNAAKHFIENCKLYRRRYENE